MPAPQPLPATARPPAPFDWPACVAAFTPEHAQKLAEWRDYSPEFVTWLHGQALVGLFEGERIAFAVCAPAGAVAACHYRRKEDGSWRFHPTGTRTAPLIFGDLAHAQTFWAFESQWDLFAVADKLGWHSQAPAATAAIATRGASNARLLTGRCRPDATVLAFAQNDAAGQKWLADLAAACGCKCVHVITPGPHKDANDWTRGGASRQEIEATMLVAQPVPAATVDLHAPRVRVSKAPIVLPEDEPDPDEAAESFPVACLAGHVEITHGKAKTRQRRLVEVCPALSAWLEPQQGER